MAANKQLQRTVRDKVPSHQRRRAAAELRRYAALDPWCRELGGWMR
jgi:hypothetical protein